MTEFNLVIDAAQLSAETDRMFRHYLSAGTQAVGAAAKGLERQLEAATAAAVPGRLWRAWASDQYPKRGPARNPTSVVYLKGGSRTRGAMNFWSKPGEVRGKSGQYLAIPTPAAGPRGRRRDLSPGEWEAMTGIRLRFVYRPGRASLLVADNAVLSGKSRIARANTPRRAAAGRGNTTAIIFVLIKMVRHRAAFSIEPLVRQAEADLVRAFVAAARSTA